ncbi:DUF7666 domain-containing protein [Acinetobacter haemolyticus]|uniref:DUF7666 domain-containing protein n=2 Tax=Acinetobacter haemolyticus TaxID=29430 RepID=UPI001372B614|nr:hypothetical protein [Acinetobacter haemolyticus]NAR60043.1 hypothetical protein [Acinetobacter haemolyticus]
MARPKKKTALVLRTCKSDLTSRGGFQWADVGGTTVAEDWIENKECGNGLHGWLFGSGDYSYSNYLDADSKWMVLEVDLKSIVMLGEKCKFPKAKTLFVGDKKSAADYLITNEPRAKNVSVIGASLEVGDNGSVLVGALGTATAGDWGTATAGASGTATAGASGTATAGYKGTATAGYKGTATAGASGEIRIQYWDAKAERYRTAIGYIGEDGLKADTAYKLDENHKFVEAED